MRFDSKIVALAVMAMVSMAALIAVIPDGSDAAESLPEGEQYDQDLGVFWSMNVQFVYTGADGLYIEWDFGDGTEPISDDGSDGYDPAIWNPVHTFPEIDVYTVKQTVSNTTGEPDVQYFKVDIRGYPYLTLVYGNGEENGKIQMTSGGINAVPAEEPAEDPVRDGYAFTGWYTHATEWTSENLYDWSQRVEYPTTLYAGWAPYHTVQFDTDGGETQPDAMTVIEGQSIELPSTVKDGWTMMGWYDGDAFVGNPGDSYVVTKDVTLIAHWEEGVLPQYTITFDPAGGAMESTTIVAYEGQKIILPEAIFEGHEFLGWFDGEATVGQAGAEYTVTKDITLTAHWQSSGDDAGEDEPNIWFLVGAIVCGILAIVCLAIGPNTNWYSVIGTVVFAIAAVVCGLLYAGVI